MKALRFRSFGGIIGYAMQVLRMIARAEDIEQVRRLALGALPVIEASFAEVNGGADVSCHIVPGNTRRTGYDGRHV